MFKPSQQPKRSLSFAGHKPQAGTSADVTGDAIDRMQLSSGQQGYDSARVMLSTGDIAGTAGAYARIAVEDSATGTDGWAALVDTSTGAGYVSGTIGSQLHVGIPVDLSKARRYIRANSEITATGTTTLQVAIMVDLMGAKVIPTA